MVKINKNLNIARDRHKSYVDKDRTFKEFWVGEHMLGENTKLGNTFL